MGYLWFYIAYRLIRGRRRQRLQVSPPGIAASVFAMVVVAGGFGALAALFITSGPVWLAAPFAFLTVLFVVLPLVTMPHHRKGYAK